ncbi:MAG: hypothetical protein AB7F43_03035 [Bacteriovoracia bacterium]
MIRVFCLCVLLSSSLLLAKSGDEIGRIRVTIKRNACSKLLQMHQKTPGDALSTGASIRYSLLEQDKPTFEVTDVSTDKADLQWIVDTIKQYIPILAHTVDFNKKSELDVFVYPTEKPSEYRFFVRQQIEEDESNIQGNSVRAGSIRMDHYNLYLDSDKESFLDGKEVTFNFGPHDKEALVTAKSQAYGCLSILALTIEDLHKEQLELEMLSIRGIQKTEPVLISAIETGQTYFKTNKDQLRIHDHEINMVYEFIVRERRPSYLPDDTDQTEWTNVEGD